MEAETAVAIHKQPWLWVKIWSVAGMVLVNLAFLPQTVKTVQTKQTRDLSLTAYWLYLVGLVLFVVYTCLTKQYWLLWGQAVAFGLTVALLVLKHKNCGREDTDETCG